MTQDAWDMQDWQEAERWSLAPVWPMGTLSLSKGGRGSNWRSFFSRCLAVAAKEKKAGGRAVPCFCLKLRTSRAEEREEGRTGLQKEKKKKSTRAGKNGSWPVASHPPLSFAAD